MPVTKLAGFAPDAEPDTVGVVTEAVNYVPSVRGMQAAPTAAAMAQTALAAACQGSALLRKLDTTTRWFAGTGTKLYEAASGAWTERTRASGGNYTVSATDRWRFAQFGDASLACQKGDVIQRSTSGAFANIVGSPQAKCMDVAEGFVMVANTTTSSDQWHCCARLDETSWAASTTTQATTGRLVEVAGPILGLRRLGPNFVAYKAEGVFIAEYVGPPVVWRWRLIPDQAGAVSDESIVSIGSLHLFVGRDKIWSFDGSRPIEIGRGVVTEYFFGRLDSANAFKIAALHDRNNARVYWFYPSTNGGGAIDAALVFAYQLNRWGHVSLSIQVPVDSESAQLTIDTLTTLSATIDGLPDTPFDAPFWTASSPLPVVFDTANTPKSLTGAAGTASLRCWEMGDTQQVSMLSRVRPRWLQAPDTASLAAEYRNTPDEAWSAGVTTGQVAGRFDLLQSARWHRLTLSTTGDAEVSGLDLQFVADGEE